MARDRLGAILTLLSTALGFATLVLLPSPPDPTPLETRIAQLSEQLNESARIIGEAEQEIASRRDLVEQLAADQRRYEGLTRLQEDEVQAVAQTLQRELDRAGRRALYEQIALGVLFLFAGIGLERFVFPFVTHHWRTRRESEETS